MRKNLVFLLFFVVFSSFSFAHDLRRTPYSLEEENAHADIDELPRLSEKDLSRFIENGWLVKLPYDDERVIIDARLSEKYRFCTEWTHLFLLDIGAHAKLHTGRPVKVTSAIRTVEYQKSLKKINLNAADGDGPKRSSHLTGATIDITKVGMTKKQIEWMRGYLAKLKEQGLIHVTEEFYQAVFHIMVLKKYTESRIPQH